MLAENFSDHMPISLTIYIKERQLEKKVLPLIPAFNWLKNDRLTFQNKLNSYLSDSNNIQNRIVDLDFIRSAVKFFAET